MVREGTDAVTAWQATGADGSGLSQTATSYETVE